ncbi:MAG: extracellular solute-binding protein [Caldicoprobacterales bacterium]|nr:extracellular solute-binding protein [Clostridiales bacterium]
MRNITKILSIILALVVIVGLVAACSGGTSDNNGGNQGANQGTNQGETSDKEDQLPEVYYQAFPLAEFDGKTSDDVYEEIKNYIIEQTGVVPVPVVLPRGSETEKLNLLISSDDERLDVFFSGDWIEYADMGLLMPLNDLLDEHGANIKKAWEENDYMWEKVTDEEGTIWALPRALPTTSYPTWLRKDWLDKYGLEMPKTIEDLENILRTFKEEDPAGNGQTIPLLTDLGGLYNGLSAGFTENGYGNWQDTDGKIKHPILQPGFKDAVAKMAEWYKEGYIYKESYVINREQQEQLLSSNRIGSTIMWYSLVAANEERVKANIPELEYAFAEGLKGPKGSIETKTKPGSAGMMILKKAKNPEAAMKFLDWVMESPDNFVTPLYGLDGVDREYTDKEKNLFKRISERYNGDFYIYPNNVSLRQYGVVGEDGIPNKMTQFLMDYQYRYDDVKEPFDFLVSYPATDLDELAPNRADIDRMIEEELVKFLTNMRPMSEWEDFIDQLHKIGMDELNDAYTQIYEKSVK